MKMPLVALAVCIILAVATACGSDTSPAKPDAPCSVLTAAEVTTIFGVAVNNGVHDPAEDIYGKSCAWAPPSKDPWFDKILYVTPLSSAYWKEELNNADGKWDDGQTQTKTDDTNVPNADEAHLVTTTGIDGPGTSDDTVRYVSLFVRKGDVRLEIHAFAGSRLPSHQDGAAETLLDEQVAQVILGKHF